MLADGPAGTGCSFRFAASFRRRHHDMYVHHVHDVCINSQRLLYRYQDRISVFLITTEVPWTRNNVKVLSLSALVE